MSSCTALFLIESLNSLERFLSRLPRSRRKSQRPKYPFIISFSSLGKILVLSKCFWAHPCSLCLLLHLDPNLCDSRLSRDFLIFDLSLSSLPLDLSHVDLVFLVVVVRVMALFIIHVRVRIRIRFCLCESGVVLRLVSINYVVLGDADIPIHVHQADCHWLSPMVNPFADVWAHVLLEQALHVRARVLDDVENSLVTIFRKKLVSARKRPCALYSRGFGKPFLPALLDRRFDAPLVCVGLGCVG